MTAAQRVVASRLPALMGMFDELVDKSGACQVRASGRLAGLFVCLFVCLFVRLFGVWGGGVLAHAPVAGAGCAGRLPQAGI